MSLYPVCSESEILLGENKLFNINMTKLVVYHLKDGFYATQNRCTHLFGNLQKGKMIEDRCIQCPLHHAHFNIRTGEVEKWADFPPGIQLLNVIRKKKKLLTYPLHIEKGEISVELADKN